MTVYFRNPDMIANTQRRLMRRMMENAVNTERYLRFPMEMRPTLGQPEFIAEWQENLAFKGELVRIEGSHRPPVTGRLKGVDGQGHLVIHNPEEGELRFEIGDVHLRPGRIIQLQ